MEKTFAAFSFSRNPNNVFFSTKEILLAKICWAD